MRRTEKLREASKHEWKQLTTKGKEEERDEKRTKGKRKNEEENELLGVNNIVG